MSKICILGASNIKHISLISLYTKYFDKQQIPYDIIYMDRYGIEEKTNAQNQFRYKSNIISSKFDKIKAFLGFRRFCKKILKKNKYQCVITWQTTVAYLLADVLLSKYKHKYIVNIRDYIAENNKIIRLILKKLVKEASLVTISSEGFKEFLPKGNYTRVNSINDNILNGCASVKVSARKLPYKIGFAGNCRYFRESYKLIQALANDSRFEIWYCGTNSEVLSKYAMEHGVSNVYTTPAFAPNETLDIFSQFDIVNSAFGSDAMDNRTLMPIRLYTAISMHIPMLVSERTQLAKEVDFWKIGFVIEDYSTLADELYNYFVSQDKVEFAMSCDRYIDRARSENKVFYKRLREIVEETL